MSTPPSPKYTRIRRLLKVLLGLAIVLLLGLGALLLLLQTTPAQRYLETEIAAGASALLGMPLHIQGLSGIVPLNLHIAAITLSDKDGVWLEVHDAHIKMSAAAFLRGALHIQMLSAEKLLLHRAPATSENSANATWGIASLPPLPKGIRVDAFEIRLIKIAAMNALPRMTLHATASYVQGSVAPIHVDIEGIEETHLRAALTGGWNRDTVSLSLTAHDESLSRAFIPESGPLTLEVQADGPIRQAKLVARAELGDTPVLELTGTMSPLAPLSLSLDGTVQIPDALLSDSIRAGLAGPLSVGLDATLESNGQAHIARLHLANASNGLTAQGNVDLHTALADLAFDCNTADLLHFIPALRATNVLPILVHGTLTGSTTKLLLDAKAEVSAHDWLRTTAEFSLDEGVSAHGSLKLLPAPGALPPQLDALIGPGADAEFDLGVVEGRLNIASAQARLESATLSADGSLDWAASKADLTLKAKASDLAVFGGLVGATLTGSASATLRMESDGSHSAIHFDAQAASIAVDNLRMPEATISADSQGGVLNDLLAAPLAVTLNASFPGLELQPGLPRDLNIETALTVEEFQRIHVAHFVASDGNLVAKASGQVDLSARRGDLSAAFQLDDFAAYAKPLGLPYGGKLEAEARLSSAKQEGTLELTLKGHATHLTGLSKAVARLGDAASLDAYGTYDGTSLRLDTLNASASGFTLSGNGVYTVADRNIVATLKAAAKDLAPLETLLGRPSSGSATLSADVSGNLDQLVVRGDAEAKLLRLDIVHADSAQAEFNLEYLRSGTSGTASVVLDTKGKTLRTSVAFAQSGNTLQVSELKADAAANALHAQGQWDFAKYRGSGALEADLPQLQALHTWLDFPINGAMSLDLQLADNGTALTGSIAATDLVLPGITLGSVDGKADIQGPFDLPSGHFSCSASALKAGDLTISSLALNADGPPKALRLTWQSAGTYAGATPFTLSAAGQANSALRQVELQDLSAQIDTHEIALDAPASLLVKNDRATLTMLRLWIGDGHLDLDGTLDREHIDAHAAWEQVPLALAELLGNAPLQGTTSGTAKLSGSPKAPMFSADLHLAKLQMPDNDNEDTPGIDATCAVRMEDNHASATLSASIPNALQIDGDFGVPMAWRLSPWEFSIAQSAPLTGKLTAKGDLSTLPDLLGLEGHVVRGNLAANLTIQGTFGAPLVNGHADLSEASYENLVSGAILEQVTARLEAHGAKLQLTHFSATDAASGKMQATGDLSTDSLHALSINATLESMRLVQRDDLTAEVSGTLSIAGDRTGGNVTGDLSVGPAIIVLPDRLPAQQMTTVDFRVAGEAIPDANATRSPSLFRFPVALNVHAAIPGNATVRARGLKSEWEGDLMITGSPQSPALKGALRVRSGKLYFLGRDFDLRESTITFNGGSPPSPMFNILAVSQQRNVTARVRLEGELESLNVTLESEPPSSRDDVLSQVLFGRNVSQISPLQGLQLARYAAFFDHRVSGTRLLGGGASASMLDRFSLESEAGLKDATVKAGKNLNDDLYLEFQQGVGTNSSAVSLEWLFAPNWSLRGKTGSNSEGGVGLFWKKDY